MTVEGKGRAAAAGLGKWLERIAPRGARGLVSVAIVPDATVRRLNRRYRGVDRATDVLSFPSGVSGRPPGAPALLGDIVIAHEIARKQAQKLGHSLRAELRVLALHGLLHLLGYDHEIDDGRMARVETRLRRRGGLPTGLIARSS